jgi:phospholipid/cholesterol/gamma-HCH transport system substrate-binding protein
MNSSTDTTIATRFKVGLFTVLGLLLVGALTIYVNHKPQWWRSCQLVHISVEDGTGLKAKSPIRSLGIEIGYIKTIELKDTYVDLGICITAQVEVLPATRAYLRGEGFLGDKFVELKPVRYVGPGADPAPASPSPASGASPNASVGSRALLGLAWVADQLISSAAAAPEPAASPAPASTRRPPKEGREIPVGQQGQDIQQLVSKVDDLVNEMTNLTTNLKSAINPEELRSTMRQLNRTLENASRTLSPEGGLNQTAQRTLGKLEDAIEQLRDQMTRINKGEGSVGMLLNDPSYADEVRQAIRNVNKLLGNVSRIRFIVDVGGEQINAYNGGRGQFRLQIYPKPDYYYLLGISIDPRGKITKFDTETTVAGTSTVTSVRETEPTALLITGMIGKVLWNRLDLSIGALHSDGVLSTSLRLGPTNREEMFQIRNDVYSRGSGVGIDDRLSVIFKPWEGSPNPWHALYVKAGLEGFRTVNTGGVTPYFYGAGIAFEDEDIKLLFALR